MYLFVLGIMDQINYVFIVDSLKTNSSHLCLIMNIYSVSVSKLGNNILLKKRPGFTF